MKRYLLNKERKQSKPLAKQQISICLSTK